ncbi:unnamed protein product, partial [Urochloa humidicola]
AGDPTLGEAASAVGDCRDPSRQAHRAPLRRINDTNPASGLELGPRSWPYAPAHRPQPCPPAAGDRAGLRVRQLGSSVPPVRRMQFGEAVPPPEMDSAGHRPAAFSRAWNISTSRLIEVHPFIHQVQSPSK